jgi:hypothetical protein
MTTSTEEKLVQLETKVERSSNNKIQHAGQRIMEKVQLVVSNMGGGGGGGVGGNSHSNFVSAHAIQAEISQLVVDVEEIQIALDKQDMKERKGRGSGGLDDHSSVTETEASLTEGENVNSGAGGGANDNPNESGDKEGSKDAKAGAEAKRKGKKPGGKGDDKIQKSGSQKDKKSGGGSSSHKTSHSDASKSNDGSASPGRTQVEVHGSRMTRDHAIEKKEDKVHKMRQALHRVATFIAAEKETRNALASVVHTSSTSPQPGSPLSPLTAGGAAATNLGAGFLDGFDAGGSNATGATGTNAKKDATSVTAQKSAAEKSSTAKSRSGSADVNANAGATASTDGPGAAGAANTNNISKAAAENANNSPGTREAGGGGKLVAGSAEGEHQKEAPRRAPLYEEASSGEGKSYSKSCVTI